MDVPVQRWLLSSIGACIVYAGNEACGTMMAAYAFHENHNAKSSQSSATDAIEDNLR